MPVVLFPQPSGYDTGHPTLSLEGSGLAVPRGVEASFSYRGFVFNSKGTIDRYKVISIDGLSDPDIRDNREENPATHGETSYESFYGGRTLAFKGRIEAFQLHKLRDMQEAMRTAFSDISREYPLYFLTGNSDTDHYINCKKHTSLQWTDEQDNAGVFWRDFIITVRASNPRFLRNKRKIYTWDDTGLGYINVHNMGNVYAEPEVKIYGQADDVQILNEESGETWELKPSVTVPAGKFYKAVMETPNNTLIDSDGVNRYNNLLGTSDKLKIYPGQNTLSFGTTTFSSGGFIEIKFRDSWV